MVCPASIKVPPTLVNISEKWRDIFSNVGVKSVSGAIIAGRIRHDTKNYYILSQMVGKGKVRKLFHDIDISLMHINFI